MSDDQAKPMKYEDVPEDWRKHWIEMGVPEGQFPPAIDDKEFFDQFANLPKGDEGESQD